MTLKEANMVLHEMVIMRRRCCRRAWWAEMALGLGRRTRSWRSHADGGISREVVGMC